jgi:N-acetylmuramoyl-L-alanine amidase
MTKVVVNGGHEPNVDPGALGSKATEAEVTQKLMLLVSAYLEKAGCEVMAVQTADLADICNVTNRWGADILVSIHCNAFNQKAKGTETFAYYGSREGDSLAHHIQSQIVTSLATTNRGVKEAGFYVLKHSKCTAVLVETAFIDNKGDEQLLIDKTDEFARAIARGVTDYIVARGEK